MLDDFEVNQLATAGLEMDVLPANLYIGFQKNFPKCRWVDASGIIRKLRMIKSAYEDEYPIISPRFDGILEEGMVFALEPMFVFPKQGVVGLEDDYRVTSEGLERLTLTEQSLIQI